MVRGNRLKVILIQLPLQGHDFFYSNENIPIASAYLRTIAKEEGIEAEILPSQLMSYGSDQAILKYIINERPDIIGMSCYEWNVERSLFLSKKIKEIYPSCLIVIGGPEVTPENDFLLERGGFDAGIVGEGEGIWRIILKSFPRIPQYPGIILKDKDGSWHFNGNRGNLSDLQFLPSPFLRGDLDSQLKNVLWLESLRGCVNRCAYCFYHKKFPRLRLFPLKRILLEVNRAQKIGIEEIVFLDPCFTSHPQLKELLNGIKELNRGKKIKFHIEGRAEDVDSEISDLMSQAGIEHIEVGIQSLNRNTLKIIHRTFDKTLLLRGIRTMQRNGIKVMVDLMAGLPGDSLADICKGINWVMEEEAFDFLMLYPLSLIPSTELYQRKKEFSLHSMPHPPYLLTRNENMEANEMREAFRYYEEIMGEEVSPIEMPPALNPSIGDFHLPSGLINFLNLSTPEDIEKLNKDESNMAYALTLRFTKDMLRAKKYWVSVLKNYLERNPFTLLSIEVPPDVSLKELKPLWKLGERHEHFIDRDYTVCHTPYRSFLVFSRSQGLLWKWPDPRESKPLTLFDGQRINFNPVCVVYTREGIIPEWFLTHMARRYNSLPEFRIWQPPGDE